MKLVTAALLAAALILPVVGLASPASAITGVQAITPQATMPIHKKTKSHKAHKGHKHHKHHKHHKKTA